MVPDFIDRFTAKSGMPSSDEAIKTAFPENE